MQELAMLGQSQATQNAPANGMNCPSRTPTTFSEFYGITTTSLAMIVALHPFGIVYDPANVSQTITSVVAAVVLLGFRHKVHQWPNQDKAQHAFANLWLAVISAGGCVLQYLMGNGSHNATGTAIISHFRTLWMQSLLWFIIGMLQLVIQIPLKERILVASSALIFCQIFPFNNSGAYKQMAAIAASVICGNTVGFFVNWVIQVEWERNELLKEEQHLQQCSLLKQPAASGSAVVDTSSQPSPSVEADNERAFNTPDNASGICPFTATFNAPAPSHTRHPASTANAMPISSINPFTNSIAPNIAPSISTLQSAARTEFCINNPASAGQHNLGNRARKRPQQLPVSVCRFDRTKFAQQTPTAEAPTASTHSAWQLPVAAACLALAVILGLKLAGSGASVADALQHVYPFSRQFGIVSLLIGSLVFGNHVFISTQLCKSRAQLLETEKRCTALQREKEVMLEKMPVGNHHWRSCEVYPLEQQLIADIFDSEQDPLFHKKRFPIEDLHMHQLIGLGQFGEVHVAVLHGRFVATKSLHRKRITAEHLLVAKRTAKLHLSLRPHPNVIAMDCMAWDAKTGGIIMVMELCYGGNLANALTSGKLCVNGWREKLNIATGIADGLNFLHGHTPPILHRDIKPDNILLDINMNPKIGDLGLSREQAIDHTMSYTVGTPLFAAPEMLGQGQGKYDAAVDMWSLGCLLACLHYDSPSPYQQQVDILQLAAGQLRPEVPIGSALHSLVHDCCEFSASMRPNAAETGIRLKQLSSYAHIYD